MPIVIDPPRCDGPVYRYSIAPDLPQGMRFSTTSGKISGKPLELQEQEEWVVTAHVLDELVTVTTTFKLRVDVVIDLSWGLNAKYTPEGYCGKFIDYDPIWGQFEDGTVPISDEGVIPYAWGSCDSASCDWDMNINRYHRLNFCMKITGFIQVDVPGLYSISLEADDSAHLFIDNMDVPVVSVTYLDNKKVYDVNFKIGYHNLGILYQQTNGAYQLKLEWMSRDAGIFNYVRIPQENLRYEPSPVQHLHYESTHLTFVKGHYRSAVPTYFGSPTRFSAQSLPEGLLIVPGNGTIYGIPKNVDIYRRYLITAVSGGTSTAVVYLNIQVVDMVEQNMRLGVIARFFRPTVTSCFTPPNVYDGYHTMALSEVTDTVFYKIGIKPFKNLPADLNSTFVVEWTGYMKIDTPGDYRFRLVSVDGNILYMENQNVSNYGCVTNSSIPLTKTSKINIKTAGYKYFRITYYRQFKHAQYGSEIYWTVPGGSETEFPKDKLFYIPHGELEYQTRVASYPIRSTISKNQIIKYQFPQPLENFYVYPTLPKGLYINPLTGTISGSVLSTTQKQTRYYITGSTSGKESTFGTVVYIETHSSAPPLYFYYVYESNETTVDTILGKVGQPIEKLKPYIVGDNSILFDVSSGSLPLGVTLDRNTGKIEGTAYSDTIGRVTISASNTLATISTTLNVNVEGCDKGGDFIYLSVMAEDPQVSIEYSLNNSILLNETFTHYGNRTAFGKCFLEEDIVNLTIISKAPRPPLVEVRLAEHTYLVNRLLTPFNHVYQKTIDHQKIEPKAEFSNETLIYYEEVYGEHHSHILQGGIKSASINPRLPGGLYFFRPGAIVGIPRKASPRVEYKYSYNNTFGNGTTTLGIEVQRCDGGNIPFELSIKAEKNGATMTVKMENVNTKEIIADYVGFKNYEVSTYTYCKPRGNYKLYLGSTDGLSWSTSSMVNVYYINGYEAFHHSHRANGTGQYLIDLDHLVGFYDQWAYMDTLTPPNNWNIDSSVSSSWAKNSTGNFPQRAGTTQYFVKAFNFAGELSTVSSLVSAFKYDAGIVVYLNGIEIYRNNVGSGTVTPTTSATKQMTPNYYRIGLPSTHLKMSNILAVELHSHISSSKVNCFGGYLDAVEQECSINYLNPFTRGNLTLSHRESIGYPATNLLDNSAQTQWIANSFNDKGTTVVYTLRDQRVEFVNTYTVVLGDTKERDPISWNFHASVDGVNFELLDSQKNQGFVERQSSHSYYFNAKKSYNAFKWEILTHGDYMGASYYGIQVADFLLYACNVKYCHSEGKWKTTRVNGRLSLPCPRGYSGGLTRSCNADGTWAAEPSVGVSCQEKAPGLITSERNEYVLARNLHVPAITFICDALNLEYTLKPELPRNLVLDSKLGIISGTPIVTLGRMLYNISACNQLGCSPAKMFYLSIIISECPDDLPWKAVEQGEYSYLPCQSGYVGEYKRRCVPSLTPYWEEPIDTCHPKPKSHKITAIVLGVCGGVVGLVVILAVIRFYSVRKGPSAAKRTRTQYEQLD